MMEHIKQQIKDNKSSVSYILQRLTKDEIIFMNGKSGRIGISRYNFILVGTKINTDAQYKSKARNINLLCED